LSHFSGIFVFSLPPEKSGGVKIRKSGTPEDEIEKMVRNKITGISVIFEIETSIPEISIKKIFLEIWN